MLRKTIRLFGAAMMAALMPTSALATVDQQNLIGDDKAAWDQVGYGFGQSFTPTLAGIDYATFRLASSDYGPATARVDLWQGAGFGGTLLGSTAEVEFGRIMEVLTFDFPSLIALTPGDIYTLRVVLTGGGWYFAAFADTAPYAGGNAFVRITGIPSLNTDLSFSEGISEADAAPEPAAWAMMIAGFGLVGGAMRSGSRRGARLS